MLLKFLLLLFCAVHCCIMMMGFPSFICAGFTEWYCFLCQVEHKVTSLWPCPCQCGIFQSESCNQIVRPHIYWIEKVCKLPQVTNYPKFLREIELYGRSNITHMEERVIDFPDNLQDFFDKNPEVWVWTKSDQWEMSIDKVYKVCENNLEFTNTPHTPMKRDGVLFITQRRQVRFVLQNRNSNVFSRMLLQIMPGNKWPSREPSGNSSWEPCGDDLPNCGR